MIKTGLRNFVKGLKYSLVPYGATLLFFAVGLCIAIPACIDAVTRMTEEVSASFGDIPYNWDAANGSFINSILGLNWQEFLDVFK